MTHQPSTYLDETRLNTCQRPTLYRFWQSQSSEEVARVVGQNEQRQPHFVGYELVTRESSPIEGVLAFLDPPLCGASVIWAGQRRPGLPCSPLGLITPEITTITLGPP